MPSRLSPDDLVTAVLEQLDLDSGEERFRTPLRRHLDNFRTWATGPRSTATPEGSTA